MNMINEIATRRKGLWRIQTENRLPYPTPIPTHIPIYPGLWIIPTLCLESAQVVTTRHDNWESARRPRGKPHDFMPLSMSNRSATWEHGEEACDTWPQLEICFSESLHFKKFTPVALSIIIGLKIMETCTSPNVTCYSSTNQCVISFQSYL